MNLREVSIAFQTDKTPSEYIGLAKLVNTYAFDAVTVYCDLPYQPSYGPLLLMAPHIQKARLGPAGIAPSRIHPLDIASQTALLAHLAKGGVYIGLVRGAWLEAHGIPEVKPPVQAMREAVEILRYMLSGEEGGYKGKLYQLAAHVSASYPLPQGHIPLLIGTWGRSLAALAGETADEVKIGGSANPDMVPIMQGYVAVGERCAGREPGTVGVVVGAVTVVDEDRDTARAAARKSAALYLPVVAPLDPSLQIEPELLRRIKTLVEQQQLEAAAQQISDELLDKFAFSGNPDDIVRQSEALFAAGARRIEFGTPHGLPSERGIKLLGEKVLPALR